MSEKAIERGILVRADSDRTLADEAGFAYKDVDEVAAATERTADVEPREQHTLSLVEPDLELLLMRFLNELVFLRDARSLLLHAGRVRVTSDGYARLEAVLEGERIDRSRHALACDVKAATAHRLRVLRGRSGWSASVTLDV